MVTPASEKASVMTFSFGIRVEVPTRQAAGAVAVVEVEDVRAAGWRSRRDQPTYFDSVKRLGAAAAADS